MRFVGRRGDEITTLDDWASLGKPAAEGQWVEGRSAYELAVDWIEHDAVERVTQLLAAGGELAEVELIEGVVEKKTQFDADHHGPRNHDLLVRSEATLGPVIVGIEGKADETFDHPLWRWRAKAIARSIGSGAPKRLDKLTQLFFRTTIDKDHDYPPLGCLGYQLLSALAGTLADAKNEPATMAVLLVHEFVTDKTDDEKHAVNAAMLEDFLMRLSQGKVARVHTQDGWISAPINVRGDGHWMPESLPVSVAKLVTNRRGSSER